MARFPTRSEVDAANNAKMRQLAGKVEVFEAIDGGTPDLKTRDRLLNNCMAPQRTELKVNSQVMLIKNVDETLVNGSLGRVVGFMNDQTFDLVSTEGDLDEFVAGAYDEGSQSDAEESPLLRRRKRIKAKVAAAKASNSASRVWPLVQFVIPDGKFLDGLILNPNPLTHHHPFTGSTRQLLVQPEQWKVELPNGEIQASRLQIPLILAWALSIHKAQGQTLERVKVDLGKVFEKGQAYVALSRATCQEGLQVSRFDPNKVMAHEKVRRFYASLYSAMDAGAGAWSTSASANMTGVGLATTGRKTSATITAAIPTTSVRQPIIRRKKDEIPDSEEEEDNFDYDYVDESEEDEKLIKRKLVSSYG